MCSAPVLQSVMAGSFFVPNASSPTSRQPVDAFDLARRKAADPMVGAAAVGECADDRDFVWQRGVRERDGDAVVVRTDVERVLMRKRNVDGGARRGPLGERGDPRLAAAGGLAHNVSEHGGEHGYAVLLLAVDADDGGLAVALRLVRRKHGNRERADRAADPGAGVGERLEV